MIRQLLLLSLGCLLLSSYNVLAENLIPYSDSSSDNIEDPDPDQDDDYDSSDFENPNLPFYMEICCNLFYRAAQCCGFDDNTKYIFVTSTEFSADLTASGQLGGVTGADAICQEHAQAGGMDGLFKAWIATSEDDTPRKRFSRSRANYVRRDNEVVYRCWDRMIQGRKPENTFWMDEHKNLIDDSTQGAATNLDEFGRYFENSENVIGSCFDFTYDATRGGDLTPSQAAVGVSETAFGLRPDRFVACNEKIRLICVEQ